MELIFFFLRLIYLFREREQGCTLVVGFIYLREREQGCTLAIGASRERQRERKRENP